MTTLKASPRAYRSAAVLSLLALSICSENRLGAQSIGDFNSATACGCPDEASASGAFPSCGAPDCGSDIGSACLGASVWYGGLEATMLQPRFGNNTAFTRMQADGNSFEDFTDTEFDYGLEFAPRVYLGLQYGDGVGFRLTWWGFDHNSATASTQPPANGFGRVTHPTFGDIDISTVIPSDRFTAASSLIADALDAEVTKAVRFSAWQLGVSAGFRYARVEQRYLADLRTNGNVSRGRIGFSHEIAGFGPTLSLSGDTPLSDRLSLFGRGRGALLFGSADSRLVGGEDLDLTTPFSTSYVTSRDDLLPTAELQLGLRWQGSRYRGQTWQPQMSVAMEGQTWSGAGNASSESGDLGFFGLAASMGCLW